MRRSSNQGASRAGEPRSKRRKALLLLPVLALGLSGCTNLGAARMGPDRFDFAMRLRETNKEQLLLNIVAMRYGDAPAFLEVTSVISQYSVEGSARAELRLRPPTDGDIGNVQGGVLLRETPTITYTPLSGDRFARGLLSPLPPAALLAMMEAGWAPEYLFRLSARSINGIGNGGHDPLFTQASDPRFLEVLEALGRLQRSGALSVHVERQGEGEFTASATLADDMSERDRTDLAFVARTLNLPGDGESELAIRFASAQTSPNELAIGSRSMFEIFVEMSQGVQLPDSDAEDDRAGAQRTDMTDVTPLIQIRSGKERPADPHVAIRYRGHWFWIDGNDTNSKRMFLIAQILLSLNDTSDPGSSPLVTIPTG